MPNIIIQKLPITKSYRALKNYKQSTREISHINLNFEKNVSKDISYAVENIAGLKSEKIYSGIIEQLTKLPESLFKPLTSTFLGTGIKSISELQEYRKVLKIICKKNPDAREHINSLRKYINETPETKEHINNTGKALTKYMLNFLNNKSRQNPRLYMGENNYIDASKKLIDTLKTKSLSEHLDTFLSYISQQ